MGMCKDSSCDLRNIYFDVDDFVSFFFLSLSFSLSVYFSLSLHTYLKALLIFHLKQIQITEIDLFLSINKQYTVVRN